MSDALLAERMSDALLADATTVQLVLGVMTAPAELRNRQNVRRLSHREPGLSKQVVSVFVLGDVSCARRPTTAEAREYQDIVFVNSSDCSPWSRAPKVHAWFEFALATWPKASWYGKSLV